MKPRCDIKVRKIRGDFRRTVLNTLNVLYITDAGNRIKEGMLEDFQATIDKIDSNLRISGINTSILQNRVGNVFSLNEDTIATFNEKELEKYRPKTVQPEFVEEKKIEEEVPEQTPEVIFGKGQYVSYKGETYIVTKENENSTIQIYNPLKEGADAKLSVSKENLTPLESKAKIVSNRGKEFIVTPRGTIISLITNKKMNWAEDNGERKEILEKAGFKEDNDLPPLICQ